MSLLKPLMGVLLWVLPLLASAATTTSPLQNVTQLKLDNGLTLYHAQLPQARFFKLTFYVWAGSADENPTAGDEGAAHFVEHLLFNHPQLSEADFDQRIASMGGSHNAFTHRPFTRFYVFLPKVHWHAGSQLLWNVVFNDQLMAEKRGDILRVIDHENGWSDPTWIDLLRDGAAPPGYLKQPEFWQDFFALPEYDRPVGGRAVPARQVSFAAAQNFHQRFYTVPNMTAIYVGPQPIAQVIQQLNLLAKTNPGNTAGTLHQRDACSRPDAAMGPYRRLEFDDQQPSITMGYLLQGMQFADSPYLTLYSESLNRFLYQQIRQQNAETYSTERYLEIFRNCGYVAFRTQASRLRFPTTLDFMRSSIIDNNFSASLSEEDFNNSKQSYLSFVSSRLENPEFLEAYLSLMIREHPTHQPSRQELDWLNRVNKIGFTELQEWTQQRFDPAQAYVHLNAPSYFIPYEVLPLFILVAIATYIFWRRRLLNPRHLRGVFHTSYLQLLPIGIVAMGLLYYGAFLVAQHLLFLSRLLLGMGLRHDLPLYLSGYLNVMLPPAIVGSCLILVGVLMPRKVQLVSDRVTLRFCNAFSWAIPFSNIQSIRLVSMREMLQVGARPLHLFVCRGQQVVLIVRHHGCPLALQVTHPELFMAAWHQGPGSSSTHQQQLLFPT